MTTVYVDGQAVHLNAQNIIGQGGEADIYNIGKGRAIKLFKTARHADYAGKPLEQKAATARLKTHQKKLPAFPAGLPDRVIAPRKLAKTQDGSKILGYQMPLIAGAETLSRYGERRFRENGVPNDQIGTIFQNLHQVVSGIHASRVVIGDFNDLNVLVKGSDINVIDTDSFQYGQFTTSVFTEKFVDPLLCDSSLMYLMLARPHTAESDWYAYTIMLMQSLLFVGPYGGIYRPQDVTEAIPASTRPLKRITVWHPEVRYPKPATPYGVLSDDLLHHFTQTFEKDRREIFPVNLIANLRWTTCTNCGIEHARPTCPNCAATTASTQKILSVRGKVQARELFRTNGVIVQASIKRGRLQWLYHERGRFYREGGNEVAAQSLDPQLRFRIKDRETLIAKGDRMVTLTPSKPPQIQSIDSYQNLPMFDVNEHSRFWLSGGQLWRDAALGPKFIGNVLENQTLFWVGATFGFGFYRAGELSRAFVFDANRQGINDQIPVTLPSGQLVDSSCVFASDRAWFFTSAQESGRVINRCMVVDSSGVVLGAHQTEANDGSWLGTIRSGTAAGQFLLVATDDGVVRAECVGNGIAVTKDFPDTTAFVNSGSRLLAAPEGLYVISRNSIRLMTIK